MSGDRRDADPDARLESGEAWESLCRVLAATAQRVIGPEAPDSARHRAEGYRHLCRFLAAGLTSCVTHDDPDYPVFGRMMDYTLPWGLDNPDCLYLYAPLRGDAAYRIWGNRGSARHLDLQVNAGHYALGEVAAVRTLACIEGDELEPDSAGDFELRLGGPEAGRGARLPLGPDARFVLVRQYFADWETERPADLWIERVGAEYPIPPPTAGRVVSQLEQLASWLEKGGALWDTMSRGFLSLPPNHVIVHRADAAAAHSGLRGQSYAIGNFHCGPEEAVVVELAPPACRHWSVALANELWEQVEFGSRQSSLNGRQARLDPDGGFRGVIAHADPGVWNWLDPGGNERGTLAIRFLGADAVPEIALRRVPRDELGAVLPPGTPRVGADERRRALDARRRAVLRRYRR